MHDAKVFLRFVGAIGALICGACSSGDSDGERLGSPSSSGDFCNASCNKEHACDKGVDLQTCANLCNSELAGSAPKLRADYVRHISECYAAEDCATVLADRALDACVAEATAVLSPTAKGAEFCAAFEATVEKCDATFDKATCYDLTKTRSDYALGEAEKCFSKSCGDVIACVSATL